MQIGKLICWCSSSSDPFHIVPSEVVEPLEAISSNDERKEVGHRIVVIWVCQDKLALELRVGDGGVRVGDEGSVDFGVVEGEATE